MRTIQLFEAVTTHELASTLFEDAANLGTDLYDPQQLLEVDPTPKRDFTEIEYYVSSCGFSLAHLLNRLNQLIHIPAYLREYKRTPDFRRYKITRLDVISYHYENYIIKVRSVADLSLQLIASVFHLGLPRHRVKSDVVLSNAHVISSTASDKLKSLMRALESYGPQRNEIVHQHSILHPHLRRIELMLNVSRLNNEYRVHGRTRYISLLNQFVSDSVPEIENSVEALLSQVSELFELLMPVYRKTKSRLSR